MSHLPPDLLAVQLATIDLLESMFCGEGEFTLHNPDARSRLQTMVDDAANFLPSDSTTHLLPSLSFSLNLPLHDPPDPTVSGIRMDCTLPLTVPESNIDTSSLPLPPRLSLACPTWIPSRNDHRTLKTAFDDHISGLEAGLDSSQIILEAAEWVQSNAAKFRSSPSASTPPASDVLLASSSSPSHQVFVREWYYLPSLSTKQKRQDMITYAYNHQLTGFVTPGKPGILCVEGLDRNVQSYFSDIRTKSWADIPSAHRRMTPMHCEKTVVASGGREAFEGLRKFEGMVEVTFDLHGARGNRNSLAKLEQWLTEKGVGEAFGWLFPELAQQQG
ncbi:hypothetical protein HK104_002518 [Borealophlyctis nickersoniae]|nr:hypothetical protein HK104_002518 [Borealophlyctis nickersoniae]